jgi:hypothetical protein
MSTDMNKKLITSIILLTLILILPELYSSPVNDTLRLTKQEYTDKVKAMWLGQIVAVQMGLQFEHKPAAVKDITGYPASKLAELEKNGGSTVDDDWYYEMCALAGFEKYGYDMTVEELGEVWLDFNMGTFGSAYYTRQALQSGKKGADAGSPRFNRMWFTVGNQNRSDLIAMITPGMPNLTGKISRNLGHINSYAEGTDGGVLMGGIESIAFYEKDIRKAVEKGVLLLDPSSPHRQCTEKIIEMYRSGKSFREAAEYVESTWGIEYPGTNSAVWNAGFAIIAMIYGEGDFWRSVNIGYQASDYSDADCSAANVVTVLAAINGLDLFPEHLIEPIKNRIKGEYYGNTRLTPAVDISLDELAERTVKIGLEMLVANGALFDGEVISIPVQREIIQQEREYFHPNQFTQWWNPEWTLSRAGFGAPGGGVRGIRGGTFLDGEILSTYPRDEVRGVRLSTTRKVSRGDKLIMEVAADPGRMWKLAVYVDHQRIFSGLIDGGAPLVWPGINKDAYPQPLEEYEKSAGLRKWNKIALDLSDHAGSTVVIRLYQDILVRNGFPGNAYWRNVRIDR